MKKITKRKTNFLKNCNKRQKYRQIQKHLYYDVTQATLSDIPIGKKQPVKSDHIFSKRLEFNADQNVE